MFSYFGGKMGIIHLYPKPLYNKIIEPFCGSAAYACRYGLTRDVHINDLNPVIYEIWKWIQQATKADVRTLPVLKKGEDLRDYKQLSQPEQYLLGFAVGVGRAAPGYTCTSFSSGGFNKRTGIKGTGEFLKLKTRLLKIVGKINHWKITNLEYAEIKNESASWFIDPPYFEAGVVYTYSELDFQALGKWCQERNGQVVVCEGSEANWLPFRLFKISKSARNEHKKELIWYRSDCKQPGTFF